MEKSNEDSEPTGGWYYVDRGPVDLEDRLYWILVAMGGYTTKTIPAEQAYQAIEGIVLYGVPVMEETDDKEKEEESRESGVPGEGILTKEFAKGLWERSIRGKT